jgi:2-iminobutanoate/2-iminopropanoate deaminase
MTITRTTGGAGLPAGLPFSLATEVGGVCFISAMPALASDGSFQAGDFAAEISQVWHNVVAIADAAGYSRTEIIYVQCVLADIDDYAALNDWWRREFDDIDQAPSRFTYQAGGTAHRGHLEPFLQRDLRLQGRRAGSRSSRITWTRSRSASRLPPGGHLSRCLARGS